MGERAQNGSGEERLIARYFKPLARHPGAFALLDDAAAVKPPPGCDLVLTCDTVVSGVHFFADDPPEAVAQKALRVNLSDLAAKGAGPIGFLLMLALPDQVGDDWLSGFARGLGEDADQYACPLLGGDTVQIPGPITISIAAFGGLPHGRMVRRHGAKPGDRVVITGTIGDAALGVLLKRDPTTSARWRIDRRAENHLLSRYLVPQPRNAIASALLDHASAAMDVSDGLAGDLAKLCAASSVAADIEVARVPLSDAVRAVLATEPGLIDAVLTGGDDYEVLASVPAGKLASFAEVAAATGVALTAIGTVVAGDGEARFLNEQGKPLAFARPSFSHF
jgi:thiamine-monophosphate kinase